MKALKLFGVALLAMMVCIGFAACSSDDDNESGSGLAGTSWKILSVTGPDEEDYVAGTIVTFNSNGNVTFKPTNGWTYAKWTEKDGTLKITVGEGDADDAMMGTYSISGNTATYTYWWEDADGEWSNKDETRNVMKLQRQ